MDDSTTHVNAQPDAAGPSGGKPPILVFGLDLRAIHPREFKSSRMWDRRYHLRPARFVIYQLAMLLPLAAECVATATLANYEDARKRVAARGDGAELHQLDIQQATILTIISGVFCATVFGSFFFFLLFWPTLPESRISKLAKEIAAWCILLLTLAAAIFSTVVVTTHSARVTGVPPDVAAELEATLYPETKYSRYPPALAYIILLWIGVACVFAATITVSIAASWNLKHGTEPRLPVHSRSKA